MGGTDKKPRIKKNGSSAVPPAAPDDAGAVKVGTKKRGRPTTYTQEMGDAICEALVEGKHLMPTLDALGVRWSTVCRWLEAQPAFAAMYARAGERRADRQFEQLDQLADDIITGKVDPQAGREGGSIRKWALSKRLPKKFSDKVELGGDINVTTMRLYGKDAPIDKV